MDRASGSSAEASVPSHSRQDTISPGLYRFGLAGVVALFLLSGAHFLGHQALWVDETTQLSGIALGPERLFPWLLGQGPDLGVPPDRMPPGSYLLEMLWAQAAGLSEASLRWFGLVCSAIGLVAAATASRRAYGPLAGLATATFLALSPNVVSYAVEIRAYPVFLMFTGLSLYAFVRVILGEGKERTAWAMGLVVLLWLATYTHFFGLVFGCALMAGLLAATWRNRQSIKLPVGLAFVFVLGSTGLAPFVQAALQLSSAPSAGAESGPSPHLRSIAQLVYRFYAHPATATSMAVTALVSAGFMLAVMVAVFGRRSHDAVRDGLVVTLTVGLTTAVTASFVVKGFATTAPHYNLWVLAVLAVLLARCLIAPAGWWRRVGFAGFGLLLFGSAFATLQIHRHPDAYSHGPQKRLIALVRELGADRVDVIYQTGEAGDAMGLIVFAVRYEFGRSLPQYTFRNDANAAVAFDSKDPIPALPARPHAVVIRARSTSSAELARLLEAGEPAALALPAAERMTLNGWQRGSRERFVGLVSADIEVLRRGP